jgi:predicted ATPase
MPGLLLFHVCSEVLTLLFSCFDRGWAKRLLQLFASADRPLVIVLDDVQWLAEEAQLWSSILEGRLKHVLVVSIYRTDAPDVPPPIHLVSNVQQIQVSPLTDAGVAAFLGASFGWTDEQLKTEYLPLVRFCRSKTGGNPFHLQSLVASLYYEGSFKFDFESLSWTFNLIKAEANASDAMEDLDELLARSLGSLPIQVKLCIQVSLLPSHDR